MEQDKCSYLQMIQEPICRMSTISSIFKGFCATIVAGIAGLSYIEVNTCVLILSFLPVLSFAVLDVYYLTLERRFKFLYNQVNSGVHPCNYDMDIVQFNDSIGIKEAKARIRDCIKSPSIWLFYPLMFLIVITVTILRLKGIV